MNFEPELSGCGLDSLELCWHHQDSGSHLVNTFFLCVVTFSPYRPYRFVSLECQKERQWLQCPSMVHFQKAIKTSDAMGISWNHGVGILSSFLFEVVINNTMPFFKMLFAQLILGEKVGKEKLV